MTNSMFHHSLRRRALRVSFAIGIAIACLSLLAPVLGTAASALRRIAAVQIKQGEATRSGTASC
jgi:hypothetical protein